jgi:type I restriction enzyme, S subunit
MEMKPGYKQTEVGVIPEEWEADNLGRFWSVTDCKHVTAQFVPQGFPIASIREVQSRFVDLSNAKQTTAHFYNLLIEGGRKPRPGDMILSRNATVGEVAQVADWHQPFAMGQDVCLLRRKSIEYSTEFLQAVFQSPVILNQLADLMVGSTFKRANIQQIRNFTVPMPQPPEQRAIAAALSDVDGLLGGLDRLIAKKRDLKQAAMQQLLTGQTRLPGFHGEWEVKRLGIVATVSKGTQLHSSETDEGGKYAHLNGGITPSSYTYKSNTDGKTIAISEGGNSCGFVQFISEPYWCGGHCYSVIPNGVDNHFLYHALKGQQSAIMGLRVGSGLPNVQKTGLLNFKIQLPATLPEQTAIASVLTEMDGELALLEQRREKTRALKQAMMQELLTGKTRLI